MIEIKLVKPDEVLSLRQQLLRPHQTIAECVYSCDHVAGARHFSAFDGDKQVGIVSVYPETLTSVPGENDLMIFQNKIGWRIRAMAVLPEYCKQGVGQLLMTALKNYVLDRPDASNHYIWCNARVVALEFYKRQGLSILGEEFELSGIGPHFVMFIEIPS